MLRSPLAKSQESVWRITLALLGLPDTLDSLISVSMLKQLLITPLLFTGPLYAQLLSQRLPGVRSWSFKQDVEDVFFDWEGIRNYLVVNDIVSLLCLITHSL